MLPKHCCALSTTTASLFRTDDRSLSSPQFGLQIKDQSPFLWERENFARPSRAESDVPIKVKTTKMSGIDSVRQKTNLQNLVETSSTKRWGASARARKINFADSRNPLFLDFFVLSVFLTRPYTDHSNISQFNSDSVDVHDATASILNYLPRLGTMWKVPGISIQLVPL